MGHIEKTVFLSYRRTNVPWALSIFQNLTNDGYDVFFDYSSIAVVHPDKPPDVINVIRRLRSKLKECVHPCGFSRSARRCRNISIAASPSINSLRSA